MEIWTQALAEKHEISLGPGASVDCIALMSPGPEGLYGLTMAAVKLGYDPYSYGAMVTARAYITVLSFVPLCCPDGLPWLHSVLPVFGGQRVSLCLRAWCLFVVH